MHGLSEKELLKTLHQLRQVVELMPGVKSLAKAIIGKDAAAKAIATEACTEFFLLDIWEERRSPLEIEALIRKTLSHAENLLSKNRKPDNREEILSGEEFGVVFMPPELVRQS